MIFKKSVSIIILFAVIVLFSFSLLNNSKLDFNNFLALTLSSVKKIIAVESISSKEIKNKYWNKNDSVKILIVPGHDEDFSGAVFGGVKEETLNLEMAKYLYGYLSQNPDIVVHLARDGEGYSKDLSNFFVENKNEIDEYVSLYKEATQELFDDGKIEVVKYVEHNSANPTTAFRLFGINKFASDRKYDLVLHLHFNDYPGRPRSGGKYTGFSIYAPDKQFRNGQASQEIAGKIMERLDNFYATSNNPKELLTVIPSQELIAVGSHNTLSSASVLIEYGYIYENQFHNPDTRPILLKDMALQTYLGVLDFLGDKNLAQRNDRSVLLPNSFSRDLKKSSGADLEILALQAVLKENGYYPPKNKNLNECGLTGTFGPCTELAVKNFQSNNAIAETGEVGPITREKLNDLLGLIRF